MGGRGIGILGFLAMGAVLFGVPRTAAGPDGLATPRGTSAALATPAATPAAADSVVRSLDIYFAPAALAIPAETDVPILLPNGGKALHSFTIDALGVDVYVPPGKEARAVVNAPAGSYRFYCAVWGHAAAGMVGILTVEAE